MISRSSFKGNPTLSLASETKWPFTFGLSKAKLILEHLAEIQAFVVDNDPKWREASQATDPDAGQNGENFRATLVRDPGEDAADRWLESQRQGGGR